MSVARRLLQRQRDRAELAVSLDLERQVVAHLGAVDAALRVLDVVRHPAVHLADPVERPHPGPVRRAAAVDARPDQAAGIPPAQPFPCGIGGSARIPARPAGPPGSMPDTTRPPGSPQPSRRATISVTGCTLMPGHATRTRPKRRTSSRTRFARLMGIAKPSPIEPPLFVKMNVLTPITSPSAFTSAPPEFPGLIAASVWIMFLYMPDGVASALMSRRVALTTPAVTVGCESSSR